MYASRMNANRMKKIMYINRRAPHGTNYAQEGLDVALVGAAFEQRVSLAFIDDGVFQLLRNQQPRDLAMKNFAAAFAALGDYEVHRVYVERESLALRGLGDDDLMRLPRGNDARADSLIRILSAEALSEVIAEQDVLLNF